MAYLTIVVPDDVLKRARLRAVQQGTSVNAILRDRLEAFAGHPDRGDRRRAGCNRVLTEDLAGGSMIGNVAIVNPFATN